MKTKSCPSTWPQSGQLFRTIVIILWGTRGLIKTSNFDREGSVLWNCDSRTVTAPGTWNWLSSDGSVQLRWQPYHSSVVNGEPLMKHIYQYVVNTRNGMPHCSQLDRNAFGPCCYCEYDVNDGFYQFQRIVVRLVHSLLLRPHLYDRLVIFCDQFYQMSDT